MIYTLELELPEDIYESLVRSANQTGQQPEELAVQWLQAASQNAVDDPLEPFIGAFTSGIPDLADRHDENLGKTIAETL
jgi:hypothetical protein